MIKKWTPDKKASLRTLWRQGRKVEDIAETLGVTSAAIRTMGRDLGLSRYAKRIPELSSKSRCEELCARLKAYWLDAGYPHAEFCVVEAYRRGAEYTYGVRSNLVNGLPPTTPRSIDL